jgi:predicted DNA-binding transcriptional regulator AlpA
VKRVPIRLITRAMAAAILDVSLGTLDKHVRDGYLPAPQPLGNGRRLYWLSDEFDAYLRLGLSAADPPQSGDGNGAATAHQSTEAEAPRTTKSLRAMGAAEPTTRPRPVGASPPKRTVSRSPSDRAAARDRARVEKLNS